MSESHKEPEKSFWGKLGVKLSGLKTIRQRPRQISINAFQIRKPLRQLKSLLGIDIKMKRNLLKEKKVLINYLKIIVMKLHLTDVSLSS